MPFCRRLAGGRIEYRHPVTDEMRARAIMSCLMAAEKTCQLASEGTLCERVDRVVEAAAAFALEPRLYAIAWSFGKGCRDEQL
jgi:hypothetical protein